MADEGGDILNGAVFRAEPIERPGLVEWCDILSMQVLDDLKSASFVLADVADFDGYVCEAGGLGRLHASVSGNDHVLAVLEGAHQQSLQEAVCADAVGKPRDGILVGLAALVGRIGHELRQIQSSGFSLHEYSLCWCVGVLGRALKLHRDLRYALQPMSEIIRSYGLLWSADHVFWGDGRTKGRLLGVPVRASRSEPIDFSRQAGIYVLYLGHAMIYVGQTGSGNQRLFSRLKRHRRDRLAGRWDRFSWFGLYSPLKSGRLSSPTKKIKLTRPIALNHMEAILLAAAEPSLNRQGGRFGRGAKRYLQRRDEMLGPTQEQMLQDVWEDLRRKR